MKRIKIDGVKPGDILFTARPEKLSRIIRAGTSGLVSHAMICVQHGSFIDSTSNGVHARNLQRELFDDEENAFHFRLKNPPDRKIIEQVVDYARAEIGARYSSGEALRSVIAVRKPRSKRQFCSRLVARVYKKAGIELVPDADYCSPEDLRLSSLLEELPIEFEPVDAAELARMSDGQNPVQAMHDAQNAVLEAARSVDPVVENFNDMYGLLVNRPETDSVIAAAIRNSGYLDIWKMEVERHLWRYVPGLMDRLAASHDDLKEYCIGTAKQAYSGGFRFAINLVQLQAFEKQHPRESFRLEIGLYKTLVGIDQSRREVAYGWLERHHPDLLKRHMEEIEPHTSYWWSVIDRVEPRLGALARKAVSSTGRSEVCSYCGDEPAYRYRMVNGAEAMPGVPSLRLCNDCLDSRRGMGNALMPFLSEPENT